MKLNSGALALSSAITAAVLWIVCSALVALQPGMMTNMSGHMVHMNLDQMGWSLTWTGFFIGLVIWAVCAAVTGWLVAVFYNRFAG